MLLAGYYYIGFDFNSSARTGQETNKNQYVDRDWVFNDWIVRISPGEFAGQKRIYVEDLIASSLQKVDKSDWDFNDAVFDAFVYYNPYWLDGSCAVITLRAAGGTQELTIAGREVHELFGVSQSTMVNTGVGADVPPVQFRIPGNQLTSGDANDIKVIVTNAEGEKIELTAKQGKATQKFAVPAGESCEVDERTPAHQHWLRAVPPVCEECKPHRVVRNRSTGASLPEVLLI